MTLDFGHDASQLLTLETVTQPNEVISLLRALLHQRDLPIEARTRLLQLLADAAGPAVADCLLTLRRHHGLQLTAACLTEAAPNCCSNSSSSPNTQLVLAALRTMARVPLASADQLARASVADSLQQLLRRLSGDRDAVGQLAAELLARWDRLPNETAAPGSGAAATASSTASTQAAAPDASLALTSTTPQPTADSCAAAEEFDRLFEAYAGMTEPDRKQLQAAALAGSSGGVHAILCRVLEAMLLRGGSGGGGFHARSAAMAGCVSQEDLADAAAADPNVHRLLLAVTQRGDAAVAASGGLPPQWRSARDPDGRVYFYHLGTRRTVWRDQPGSEHSWEPTYPWDALPEETAAEPSAAASEAAFEYNGAWRFQVSHDEIQDMITRNAVKIRRRERVEKVEQRRREVASSRELQQKAAFTASMKEFVHAHLQRYCAATCQTGRITNQEDLKYLVKKMTHAILLKELKHTRHIEDLEVNANVQGKAKSYISKYMRSKGSVYCRTGRPSASGHGGPALHLKYFIINLLHQKNITHPASLCNAEMTINASSKVVYALLQKAGIAGPQMCLVEVPGGNGKLALTQQQQQQLFKRADASADFVDVSESAAPPASTCFVGGGGSGTKIISPADSSQQHFRKRKMMQEPRLLDMEDAQPARIVLGSTNPASALSPALSTSTSSSSSVAAADSKIRTESENLVLQKAPLDSSTYSTLSFDEFEDDDDLLGSSIYGRKRARLNHLTADEKLTRRKVMNRIAAQQARDRKKQKMEKMESALQRLEVENRYLRCENSELKEKLEKLGSRLNHLLVQLEGGCGQGVSALSGARSTPADRTAVPVANPQQQGRGLARLLMTLALALQLARPAAHSGKISPRTSTGASCRSAARVAADRLRRRLQATLASRRKCLDGRHLATAAGAGAETACAGTLDAPAFAVPDVDWPVAAEPAGADGGDLLAGLGDLLFDQSALNQLDSLLLCDSPDAPSSESGVFSDAPLMPGLASAASPDSDDLSALLDINSD
uniref:WW domain-containing protein n=1 Tax=Macrostomum lignano TaxID=282301 RepID=A0A1I8G5F4_9PLAT